MGHGFCCASAAKNSSVGRRPCDLSCPKTRRASCQRSSLPRCSSSFLALCFVEMRRRFVDRRLSSTRLSSVLDLKSACSASRKPEMEAAAIVDRHGMCIYICVSSLFYIRCMYIMVSQTIYDGI